MDIKDVELHEILNFLSASGHFLGNYKTDFLKRRVCARMIFTKSPSPREYLELLMNDESESRALLDSISINVSGFFRDPPVWEGVRRALKERLEVKSESGLHPTLRIWSAGCSCGEEPYTAAIVALETIRETGISSARAVIIATDIDKKALEKGVAGVYSHSAIKELPPHLTVKYMKIVKNDQREGAAHSPSGLKDLQKAHFDVDCLELQSSKSYSVKDELRKMVKFRIHDIFIDPPLPLMDMVLCRNVLIYATPEMQRKAIGKLVSSLVSGGFLILGMNEVLFPGNYTVEPFEPRLRIYKKAQPNILNK